MPQLKSCKGPECAERKPRAEMLGPMKDFCSADCGYALSRQRQDKAREKARRKVRAYTRKAEKAQRVSVMERKNALRTPREATKKTQPFFNRWVRLRDRDKNCISCNRTNAEVESTDGWKPGGAWDCGHFQSVASHPELRFSEQNAYKQCKTCNGGSGQYAKKNHTVGKQYRINLIQRVGLEVVEWLEGPHKPAKLTVDDLDEIKAKYRDKIKEFEL